MFLAAWLPFNNGLRPEPLIAFGVVADVGAGRDTRSAPAGCGPPRSAIVVAVFSVTLAPQGLIALAPLLVGARAIARIIARRRAADGLLAQLAAAGGRRCR